MIKEEYVSEFVGQVIDIFEDFLSGKGIDIPNEDREPDNDVIIFGDDYGEIQTQLESMLNAWELVESGEE